MRPRLGISSCLLGQKVRHDGGHKRDRFLEDTLGMYVDWVPVCPEVEMGLGIPRETIRLVGDPEAPHLIAPRSGKDHTKAMETYSRGRVRKLAGEDLHGYVLKKDSPSCGMARVKVWNEAGKAAQKKGVGLYARELMRQMPLLPVEDEGRLNDSHLRENFVERIFAYVRWTNLMADRPRRGSLVQFHADHKLTLMAHNPERYRALGRLVGELGKQPFRESLEAYGAGFMEALQFRATLRKHANVLYHMMGFLKNELDAADRAELVECIEAYRNGMFPLIVPVTLLKHHFRRHPVEWIDRQTYLNPYPEELMLRNHV